MFILMLLFNSFSQTFSIWNVKIWSAFLSKGYLQITAYNINCELNRCCPILFIPVLRVYVLRVHTSWNTSFQKNILFIEQILLFLWRYKNVDNDVYDSLHWNGNLVWLRWSHNTFQFNRKACAWTWNLWHLYNILIVRTMYLQLEFIFLKWFIPFSCMLWICTVLSINYTVSLMWIVFSLGSVCEASPKIHELLGAVLTTRQAFQ